MSTVSLYACLLSFSLSVFDRAERRCALQGGIQTCFKQMDKDQEKRGRLQVQMKRLQDATDGL